MYLGFTLRVLCVWSYANSSSSGEHKAPRSAEYVSAVSNIIGTNNCEISHLSVGRIVCISCAYIYHCGEQLGVDLGILNSVELSESEIA